VGGCWTIWRFCACADEGTASAVAMPKNDTAAINARRDLLAMIIVRSSEN
jgi:hypothetical protein